MQSTLAVEKRARVRLVFGVSNYVNRTGKDEIFREIQASLNGKTARYPT